MVSALAACTLTSDPFTPEFVDGALQPSAGTAASGPDAGPGLPGNSPGVDVECSSENELAGCNVGLMPVGSCASDADCESGACIAGACAPASCGDGRQNAGEQGVDCGGPCERACPGCTRDADCESKSCQAGECQPATCDDGRLNQGEAATDCAGPCTARCEAGVACTADADCGADLFCPAAPRVCTSVSCQDGALNGDELLTDCGGGTCPGCPVDTTCNRGTDCSTGVCGTGGTCAAATCTDSVRNQNETGVDCGGACPDCATGEPCGAGGDCQSGVCGTPGCEAGMARCCQAPRCDDGVRNGNEPATDCGNAACGLCGVNEACTANAQCTTGLCQAGACRRPPCTDGARNGTETDTDCGGADPACRRCGSGEDCAVNTDCASNSCSGGVCIACNDRQRNGTETAVDCGGACAACAPGQACLVDADCQSGACQDGRCCGGNLLDCTRCARRLSQTLDCNSNGPTGAAECTAFLDCLSANPGACPLRYEPGCSDDPGGVCASARFGGNTGPGVILADAILGTAACTFGEDG